MEGRKRVRAFVGAARCGRRFSPRRSPAPGASAATPCPGTFKVLHNDRIGPLQHLPQGNYVIKVKRMTCQTRVERFTELPPASAGQPAERLEGESPAKKKFANRALGNAFKIRPAA